MLMSSTAGKHTGTVTRLNMRPTETLSEADTDSNSLSSCLSAVIAVMWLTV